MSWAGRRKFLITATSAALILFVLALILVPTFYQSPSCTDRRQNQDEEGIDCGGTCSYLCTNLVQEPNIRFTRAVYPSANRVDVVAYVDNPNVDAAAFDVPFTVTLYGADKSVLNKQEGVFDLPAGRSVPVYLPGVFNAAVSGTSAFLDVQEESIRWFKGGKTGAVPSIGSPAVAGTADAPRVTAPLTNNGVVALSSVRLVAIVYDAGGTVTAASQTLIPTILPDETVIATFTWSRAFPATPARIEIVPIPPLSRSL